jgi:LacI family transcriptional regulator
MRKVSIKDIAASSGFSEATVSRALNGHLSVKDDTKRQIFEVSKRLGYKPGLFAPPNLSSPKTVGILMPDMTSPFFTSIVFEACETLENRQYHVIVSSLSRNAETERSCFKLFLDMGLSGIIVVARFSRTLEYMKSILGGKLPIALAACSTDDPEIRYVSIDHRKAMYSGTEYLIDLGHRKIYFIGANSSIVANSKRVEGFIAAIRANNIPVRNCKILYTAVNRAGGYSAALELIDSDDLPTAIIAANDYVAFGVMEAFKKKSLRIPEDISLLGFDNIETSSYSSIGLTTIQQPCHEIGGIAVDMLLNQIEHKDQIDRKHVIVDSPLIIRDTCRRVVPEQAVKW